MSDQTAKQAIARAIGWRNENIGTRISTRVEEIRPMGNGWTVVLSWLESDEQSELAEEREHPAIRAINQRMFKPVKGTRTERVYHLFEIPPHAEDDITMSTVEWAR